MSDFSDHPPSVAELRSDRSRRAEDWTPRDVLIRLLRDIDAGEVSPRALVVCYSFTRDGCNQTGFYAASPDSLITLGLLTKATQAYAASGDDPE